MYQQICLQLEWTNSHRCTNLGWGRSSRFWDEPKTHPLPAHGFFSPLFCPKIFPSYLLPPLLPTSFTSFPTHSISKAWESSWTWVAQSFEEMWDTRLEAGGELNVEGMWKGESKRSASSQMQKWKKKGKFFPFFTFFFFSMVFFSLCVCLFFLAWEQENAKKKVLEMKWQTYEARSKSQKWKGRARTWK